VAGCYEYSNDPLGSIKGGKFLGHLNDNKLLKENSALWS
jgi:hypothetical protein